MLLKFTKMHGLGNDFVVLDATNEPLNLTEAHYRQLADRHFGVGCDQILIVEKAVDPANDFRYRIYNADGIEVEQCGNGVRCFYRYVREQGLTDKEHLRIETAAGIIEPKSLDGEQVEVNMGVPEFQPARIPFVADAPAESYTLALDDEQVEIAAVSMGNPHAVQRVDVLSGAQITRQGSQIENHERFPKRVNAGFMEIVSRKHIRLRVWERGVGETLACGTGACAAVVAGRRWGLLDETVAVDLPGGQLVIRWPGEQSPVIMTGPATTVFTGEVEL